MCRVNAAILATIIMQKTSSEFFFDLRAEKSNLDNYNCYTSQLKYVFRLEENASRVVGQNSLTP